MNIIGLRLLSCPSHNELPLADVSANVSRARSVRHCWLGFLLPLFISGMSIVSCIIKHTHFSGRNVMLRSVSDRIDGGAPASVCGRSGRFCQVCAFVVYRRGRGRIGWMFPCSCLSASSQYYIINAGLKL